LRRATEDAAAARDLLDEPARAAREAEAAEAAATAARREAEAAAESVVRQRAMSQRLDEIAAEERRILAANGQLEPPSGSEAGARLRQLRTEAEQARARLSGEIEAAAGLTPEARETLRAGTPFGGAGGRAREQAFFDGLPTEARGSAGTYVDYVTGQTRPLSELAVDHVVPVDEIFRMEGFGRLSRADQLAILDMPENLRLLERGLNSSKQARSLGDWLASDASLAPRVDRARRQALADLETQARSRVQTEISDRLARMRGR
jgi:hypothetical protein